MEFIDEIGFGGGTSFFSTMLTAFRSCDITRAEDKLPRGKADTFYILTDGQSNVSKKSPEEIFETLDHYNRYQKIKIHTIGIGARGGGRKLLIDLANATRGTFIER